MLVAASEQKLTLTPDDTSTLVDAAPANPRFSRPIRAMILNGYGAYLFNVVHDRQEAISPTKAAAAQDPQNPYFQINLTKMALMPEQPDQATKHLVLAEQLDKVGTYDREINNLKLQMRQASH